MTAPAPDPQDCPDSLLICYCTMLTLGELRAALRDGRWPPAGKERTGKLCTGCQGDLLVLTQPHRAPAS
jgi:hypothetical protein